MKKSKNNNIILGFGYWVFEFGFNWCKGKVICDDPWEIFFSFVLLGISLTFTQIVKKSLSKFDFHSRFSTSKIIWTLMIFFPNWKYQFRRTFFVIGKFSDIFFKNLLDADSSPQNSTTKVMLRRDGVGKRIKAPCQDTIATDQCSWILWSAIKF